MGPGVQLNMHSQGYKYLEIGNTKNGRTLFARDLSIDNFEPARSPIAGMRGATNMRSPRGKDIYVAESLTCRVSVT